MPVTAPNRFHNVTLAGNTAGVLAEISSGTLTIAGGNNITLSQNGNAITISAAAGGGVAFSGGDSNIGNTSGDTGVVTGRLVLVGGNNITLSGSTNAGSMSITISGANAAGAQTGISGIANSETTYTSGSVTLSALGAITIRSTTGQHFQFSVNAQTQENNTLGMSNLGNTAGDSAIRTGPQLQIVLAGGNNITLSQSTNGSSATIAISAFNQTVENNTIGMSNIGNTAGDSAIRTGPQLQIVLAGGNNITLSQSTNGSSATITISAFNQSQESNTIGMSNIGNTAGDTAIRSAAQLRIVLAGGNNITLSQSTNGSSATITISAFNQTSPVVGNAIQSVSSATDSGTATSRFAAEDHKHAGVGPFGVSNIGNTSGDTGTLYGRVVLAGGNNVTLSVSSSNNGAQTITISAAAAGGAAYSAGLSNIGNTAGDTGLASQRLVLAGGNNITLSGSTNGGSMTITVSAFNQSQESNTIGMSNIGNTSGDTAIRSAAQLRIVLAGGNNITLSQSTNGSSATITISAFNQSAENQTIGMSNIGNTQGDSAIRTGPQLQIVFAGGNNITLSQSTNGSSATVTIIGAAGGGGGAFTAGMSNDANTEHTFGTSGTVNSQILFYGNGAVSLSQSINGASASLTVQGVPDLPYWEWPPGHGRHQLQTLGHISFIVQPFYLPAPMVLHSMFWMMSASGASGSTASITFPIGIYSQMTGASSTRLSLIASVQYTTSWTSNSVASNDWGGVFGLRRWNAAINATMTPGWYWVGIGHRTSNAGSFTFGCHGSNAMSGVFGQTFGSRHVLPFAGNYGTTTLTAPDSIGSNQITMANNVRAFPWIGVGNTDSINFGN